MVLTVHGDLDEENKGAFRQALSQSDAHEKNEGAVGEAPVVHPFGDIVLDLSEVTFLSEGALGVLISVFKMQKARGAALYVARTSEVVQRKLARTGLASYFSSEHRLPTSAHFE